MAADAYAGCRPVLERIAHARAVTDGARWFVVARSAHLADVERARAGGNVAPACRRNRADGMNL
ncbi:hypothetical protein GQ57_32645 [Burkholderia sp. MSh2]|nr:hypothetical protein GQ57_32645 [Burkholderia sp. MSh2]